MINSWIIDILEEVSNDVNNDEEFTASIENVEHPFEVLKEEIIKRTINSKAFKAHKKKTICAEDIWALYFYVHVSLYGGES